MTSWLTIKILGVVSAVVGPMPDWDTCTKYLPDFQTRANAAFEKPEYRSKLQQQYPGIERKDIVHECKESATKPELGPTNKPI